MFAAAAADDQNFHLRSFRRIKNDTAGRPPVSTGVRLAPGRQKCFHLISMHWDFALILLFLGVAVPTLGRRRVRQLLEAPDTTKIERLSLYASTIAFQWVAVGVILWRTHAYGIRPAQLGLAIPDPALAVTIAVVVAISILLNQIYSLRRLVARPDEIKGVLPQLALKLFPQDALERFIFFALVGTVSVCEELIYRGFVQRVFEDWSGGRVLAGIGGSAVFFALAHLYQGRRGLASTFSVGLLFSAVRAWTGSLLPTVIAHFVADFTVGMFAPKQFRAAMQRRER
jgi:membrane protease YdiL (CAAX protease family)